jgi:predicted transcriptional regulator
MKRKKKNEKKLTNECARVRGRQPEMNTRPLYTLHRSKSVEMEEKKKRKADAIEGKGRNKSKTIHFTSAKS